MIKIIGDADWTRKVTRQLKALAPPQEVTIIQLDRQDRTTGVYSSALSIERALSELGQSGVIVVLVGACPVQDYAINNEETWTKLPPDRTFFYEAGRNPTPLPQFIMAL